MDKVRLALAVLAGSVLVSACTGGTPDSPTVSSPSSQSVSSQSVNPSDTTSVSSQSPAAGADWLQYHGDPQRSGYAAGMPAASGRLTAHAVALDGQVYASPIVVAGTV
ncbi:MAG TPA: hypothetical protein VFD94_08000, partial [Jatrophihabitans sp.]|nr:hypothetical protein [Jatrophihabitans sp.]